MVENNKTNKFRLKRKYLEPVLLLAKEMEIENFESLRKRANTAKCNKHSLNKEKENNIPLEKNSKFNFANYKINESKTLTEKNIKLKLNNIIKDQKKIQDTDDQKIHFNTYNKNNNVINKEHNK